MAHQHPVKDTDLHFVIDPVTRVVKNNSGKIVIMQHDHQSEILTFELPRYIDTHDMSLSNAVRVHYINIGSSSKYEPVSGVYEITDLQIDPENENLVTCSWTLTNNTTQLEGTLNFIIRFSCLTGDTIDYSWSTAIYSGITVAKTIDSSDYVTTAIPDILEQWKASLKGDPFTYDDFTPEQLEGLRGPAGIIISETEPANGDHPVWVRPSGEYIVENLGLTGATVGQVPAIKSVDSNGVPTEWEARDSKPFVVTVTYGNNNTLTADKTHAEIVAAYTAGAQINAKVVNHPIFTVPITLPLFANISDEMFAFGGSGVTDGSATAMTAIDTNGSWRVELAELATLDDIPTEVFTVNLTMDGGGNITADKTFAEIKAACDNGKVVEAKFDDLIVPLFSLIGSEAAFAQTNANSHGIITYIFTCTSDNVWSMSEDGFDARTLGISGASAGQTVKIKTVDASGIPTEWEPADMASGEVKLIASCTLEETASAIEFTGLSVKNKSLSIRIKNTGNSCGNGWQIWVNGVPKDGSVGGTGSTSTYYANNRIWLFPDGSTLRGISQCSNGGTNHYNWTNFQGTITSIKLTSAYHSDTSKYYGIGTNVEVYEGILPNIQ